MGTSGSTGSVETQAQSFGGYWTKYLRDGTYFDGVGQLTHYHNRYGDIYGGSASQNGFGAGASGEVGKPFALGSSGVAIEPQAQLLYQYLHLNGFDRRHRACWLEHDERVARPPRLAAVQGQFEQ